MPRVLRRVPAGRRVTLEGFSVPELMSFSAAWRPPRVGEQPMGRWLTWAEYLADWVAIRGEYYADWGEHQAPSGAFADRIIAEYGMTGPPA